MVLPLKSYTLATLYDLADEYWTCIQFYHVYLHWDWWLPLKSYIFYSLIRNPPPSIQPTRDPSIIDETRGITTYLMLYMPPPPFWYGPAPSTGFDLLGLCQT